MLQAPLLLDALLEDLKKRKLPFVLIDKVKQLYEITWREAYNEGETNALNPEKEDEL